MGCSNTESNGSVATPDGGDSPVDEQREDGGAGAESGTDGGTATDGAPSTCTLVTKITPPKAPHTTLLAEFVQARYRTPSKIVYTVPAGWGDLGGMD